MKLVAVSVAMNSADLMEAFVRHTCAWVDHVLVFDHDSTDGTREILGDLIREGLPVSVFSDPALGNLQQARSNYLTRFAARELGADWVLPLDTDEFLCGPGRNALEAALGRASANQPVCYRLRNHYPTASDDAAEPNPVLRLRHRDRNFDPTVKVLVPRSLALDATVVTGMGSHTVKRGSDLLTAPLLPDEFLLAHYPVRSVTQQAFRVVLSELQRLSRGKSQAGVALHYRRSFQLLAENPELFPAASVRPVEQLELAPLRYDGGPLRHTARDSETTRLTRSLLRYLEKLAISHGELLDRAGTGDSQSSSAPPIRPLALEELRPTAFAGRHDAFTGFEPQDGWGPLEGPYLDACLPPFHWGYAPATVLDVASTTNRMAQLSIEAITYSDGQAVTVELNGEPQYTHSFQRTEQRERFSCHLPLRAGKNQLALRHSAFLQTAQDLRKLAVIYLSIRVV